MLSGSLGNKYLGKPKLIKLGTRVEEHKHMGRGRARGHAMKLGMGARDEMGHGGTTAHNWSNVMIFGHMCRDMITCSNDFSDFNYPMETRLQSSDVFPTYCPCTFASRNLPGLQEERKLWKKDENCWFDCPYPFKTKYLEVWMMLVSFRLSPDKKNRKQLGIS